MMESAVVDILQGAGPGGAIALVALYMYRQQVKQNRVDRKYSEDRLTGILEKDVESREANTTALTALTSLLQRLNTR